ncbi:glycoside hydrolase family 16 protein [Abyssalbus ytuae]|uniref:Glycoside hydrolase family 16 protein n=1 Tax=Abyssalbus ytuae TaxID=2926907 RepID=A0A9E6ZPB0_9FLAO|nr:glycoside hydrolase family 16 protein [Abyssalbus ytuae]UOB18394.1 glycoside hydrolase family 16 protein [Abyssalbus ytuae]
MRKKINYMKNLKSPKMYFIYSLLFATIISCSTELEDIPPVNNNRVIEFSGYEWLVRNTYEEKQGPGPNYFSDSEENVWVDAQGRLHLKVMQRDGKWYCAGLTLRRTFGFNKYVFYVDSRVDQLNENVVGGLFTYMNDEEEIDIEFSRWSDPENQNSQFAVQPSDIPGNKDRYDMDLEGSDLSTHFFDWQADKIEFASYKGHTLTPETEDIISTWTYTGDNVPPDSYEKVKINLWLFRGNPPTDNQEAEMIINRVEIY